MTPSFTGRLLKVANAATLHRAHSEAAEQQDFPR
tara:strand:+ start:242 stop:343 length:102 start_codon:yes stop_codon:yes gene_type:complete